MKRLLEILEADIESRVNVAGGTHKQELEHSSPMSDVLSRLSFGLSIHKTIRDNGIPRHQGRPAGGEGRLMYLRYVGTDIRPLQNNLTDFKLSKVPVPGERGISSPKIRRRRQDSRGAADR